MYTHYIQVTPLYTLHAYYTRYIHTTHTSHTFGNLQLCLWEGTGGHLCLGINAPGQQAGSAASERTLGICDKSRMTVHVRSQSSAEPPMQPGYVLGKQ